MFVYVSIDDGKDEIVRRCQSVVVFKGTYSSCVNYLKMQYVDASIKMIDMVDNVDEIEVEQHLEHDQFRLVVSRWNHKLKTNELYHATTYQID